MPSAAKPCSDYTPPAGAASKPSGGDRWHIKRYQVSPGVRAFCLRLEAGFGRSLVNAHFQRTRRRNLGLEQATEATTSKDPRHAYPDEVIAAAVEAAAPVIVAAELRRLSYEIALFAPGYHHQLLQRADQLDLAGTGGPRWG